MVRTSGKKNYVKKFWKKGNTLLAVFPTQLKIKYSLTEDDHIMYIDMDGIIVIKVLSPELTKSDVEKIEGVYSVKSKIQTKSEPRLEVADADSEFEEVDETIDEDDDGSDMSQDVI